jgi:hypothetical protein
MQPDPAGRTPTRNQRERAGRTSKHNLQAPTIRNGDRRPARRGRPTAPEALTAGVQTGLRFLRAHPARSRSAAKPRRGFAARHQPNCVQGPSTIRRADQINKDGLGKRANVAGPRRSVQQQTEFLSVRAFGTLGSRRTEKNSPARARAERRGSP